MRVNCPNVAGFRAAAMFAHIAGYACPASVFIDGGAMRDVRQLRAAAVVILKSREIVQPGGADVVNLTNTRPGRKLYNESGAASVLFGKLFD